MEPDVDLFLCKLFSKQQQCSINNAITTSNRSEKVWGHIGFQSHAQIPLIKIVLLDTLSLCETLLANWIAPVPWLRSSP